MDPLAPLISSLSADGRPRVWSLVITVFGDSVQHRGGRVAAVRLNRLLGRIGVESGALRTALSRLSRDGWVEGRKAGRTSSYALTPSGSAQFGPATAQIYAPPRQSAVSEWSFGSQESPGAIRLSGGWLRPGPANGSGFGITGKLSGPSAPEVWKALTSEHVSALHRLADDLRALSGLELGPLDAAAARTLLIHRWRRLVLRYPNVPAELFPPEFTPQNLHQSVAQNYTRLCPMAEQWLDHSEGDMPAMPQATADLAKRFICA
ncbi:MAG: PaaX family transcriptional regulator C-terminal domain-containing protein [Pelagimonas sp.]|uniref:PaaX family transcriptional regulator C-terminal domain-containing protein n=1 Tax=Pelagimonas sp. TaxID=2073170 RepID=UPI003D6C18D3